MSQVATCKCSPLARRRYRQPKASKSERGWADRPRRVVLADPGGACISAEVAGESKDGMGGCPVWVGASWEGKNSLNRVREVKTAQPWGCGEWPGFPCPWAMLGMGTSVH